MNVSNPLEVIGRGSYGLVIKGFYRATPVALKRMLPRGARRTADHFDVVFDLKVPPIPGAMRTISTGTGSASTKSASSNDSSTGLLAMLGFREKARRVDIANNAANFGGAGAAIRQAVLLGAREQSPLAVLMAEVADAPPPPPPPQARACSTGSVRASPPLSPGSIAPVRSSLDSSLSLDSLSLTSVTAPLSLAAITTLQTPAPAPAPAPPTEATSTSPATKVLRAPLTKASATPPSASPSLTPVAAPLSLAAITALQAQAPAPPTEIKTAEASTSPATKVLNVRTTLSKASATPPSSRQRAPPGPYRAGQFVAMSGASSGCESGGGGEGGGGLPPSLIQNLRCQTIKEVKEVGSSSGAGGGTGTETGGGGGGRGSSAGSSLRRNPGPGSEARGRFPAALPRVISRALAALTAFLHWVAKRPTPLRVARFIGRRVVRSFGYLGSSISSVATSLGSSSTSVATRRLDRLRGEFIDEIRVVVHLRHPNITTVRGGQRFQRGGHARAFYVFLVCALCQAPQHHHGATPFRRLRWAHALQLDAF